MHVEFWDSDVGKIMRIIGCHRYSYHIWCLALYHEIKFNDVFQSHGGRVWMHGVHVLNAVWAG